MTDWAKVLEDLPHLLKLGEVAKVLRRSKRTVSGLVNDRTLEAVKIGTHGHPLVPKVVLIEFLKSKKL